jgi:hypothetical protein
MEPDRFKDLPGIRYFRVWSGKWYFLWGRNGSNGTAAGKMTAMTSAINPKDGFKIQARYGNVEPKLLSAGAINLNTFDQFYRFVLHPCF